jgi:hypothetical protein
MKADFELREISKEEYDRLRRAAALTVFKPEKDCE